MSPRPNADVVRRIYEALKQRDIPAALALFAPDMLMEQSEEVPWGGTYRGHDGAMQFFATLVQSITSAVTIEHVIDAGEHVVVTGWTRGTVNATGAAFEVPVAHVWTVQDGKAVHVRYCIDNPTMRAALDAGA
jgi:uncharacterized protein